MGGDSETSVVNVMVMGVGGGPPKDTEDVLPGFHTFCTSFSLAFFFFFGLKFSAMSSIFLLLPNRKNSLLSADIHVHRL